MYVCSSVILSILSFLKGSKFLSLSFFLSGSLMVLVKLSYKVCVCVFLILFVSIFTLFHNSVFSRVFPSTFSISERVKKLNRDASLVIARGTKIKEGVSKGILGRGLLRLFFWLQSILLVYTEENMIIISNEAFLGNA